MLASSVPPKFPVPWGANATAPYIRTIPITTADPTAASLSLGWPPATGTPAGAGGTPPNIKDENGILNPITAWNQWQAAGAPVYYDAVFSAAVGGYPAGAILGNASTLGSFWLSLVDNNTSDPDTGGANWVGYSVTTQTVVPVGTVMFYTNVAPPAGWLECDGATISRASYAALNNIASSMAYDAPWGDGNGSTTFSIPDLRGVFIRGYDDGAGLTSDAFGSYYADEFAAHSHTLTWYGNNSPSTGPGHGGDTPSSESTSSVGGVETAPKRVSLLPCIKY